MSQANVFESVAEEVVEIGRFEHKTELMACFKLAVDREEGYDTIPGKIGPELVGYQWHDRKTCKTMLGAFNSKSPAARVYTLAGYTPEELKKAVDAFPKRKVLGFIPRFWE